MYDVIKNYHQKRHNKASEIISNGDRIIHHSAILTDPECENRKEAVLSAIGIGFALLDGLEEQLLAMLPDLEKEAEKAWDFIDQL